MGMSVVSHGDGTARRARDAALLVERHVPDLQAIIREVHPAYHPDEPPFQPEQPAEVELQPLTPYSPGGHALPTFMITSPLHADLRSSSTYDLI